MVEPSAVLLSSRSNGAPLSTASTSLRQSSRVTAGKSAASDSGASGSAIPAKCHGEGGRPTCLARQKLTCRKPFHTAGVDTRQRIAHADAGDHMVRRDLDKRHQNKSALEEVWVRQHQVGIVQRHVIVGQQIEIDRAGSPMALVRAVAAERAFAGLHARQQRMRGKRSGDRNQGVDEGRLVGHTPGRGAVIGRARRELYRAVVAEERNGAIEGGAHVAHIAAERDEGFGHGARRRQRRSRAARVLSIVTPTSSKVAAIGACGLCTVTATAWTWAKRASTASATAPAAASTSR